MSLDTIRKDIEEMFETGWDDITYGPIDWDGTKELRDTPFVRFELLGGLSNNIGISSIKCVERTGNVSIMIFVSADKGTSAGWIRGGEVAKIFENKTVNKTKLFETSVFNRGRIPDSNVLLFEATTFYTSEEQP